MKRLFLLAFVCLLSVVSLWGQNSATGNITATSSTCGTNDTSNTTACVVLPLNNNSGTVVINLGGTFVGTLQFEVTATNGASWAAKTCYPTNSTTGVSSSTATGTWTCPATGGLTHVRVRSSAYTSGTVNVQINQSSASASLGTGGGGGAGNPAGNSNDVQINSSGSFGAVTSPTTPNSVPQYLVSTPSGGVSTAPVWGPAGVNGRAVTGTTDTIVVTDRAGWVTYSNASPIAATLPQAGSTGFANNFVLGVKNIGAGTVTITPTTSTIDGGSSLAVTQGQNCSISSIDNANYVSRCASGQITAGSNITITPSANGISIASTGGGGSTINSGAGVGMWLPWGAYGYVPSDYPFGAPVASRQGTRLQFILPAQMEFRYIAYNVGTGSGTACTGGTCGLQFCIYATAMTAKLACTVVGTSGGSPNINTTGAQRLAFSTGSDVSAGVATLPAGSYYLVIVSDSTALRLKNSGDTNTTDTINAGGLTKFGYAGADIATGNGGSLSTTNDLSAITWSALAAAPVVLAIQN